MNEVVKDYIIYLDIERDSTFITKLKNELCKLKGIRVFSNQEHIENIKFNCNKYSNILLVSTHPDNIFNIRNNYDDKCYDIADIFPLIDKEKNGVEILFVEKKNSYYLIYEKIINRLENIVRYKINSHCLG